MSFLCIVFKEANTNPPRFTEKGIRLHRLIEEWKVSIGFCETVDTAATIFEIYSLSQIPHFLCLPLYVVYGVLFRPLCSAQPVLTSAVSPMCLIFSPMILFIPCITIIYLCLTFPLDYELLMTRTANTVGPQPAIANVLSPRWRRVGNSKSTFHSLRCHSPSFTEFCP